MVLKFTSHLESIEELDNHFLLGLSNLDGNIWDGSIKIISAESGTEILSRHTDAGNTETKFFGTNSEFVLSARDDGKVYLYSSQDLDFLEYYHEHDNIVSSISICPQSHSTFASSGWDGHIFVLDSQHKRPVTSIFSAHSGQISQIDFNSTFSHLLVSTGQDGFLRLWDFREDVSRHGCSQIVALKQGGSCVHWDKSDTTGLRCLVGCEDGTLSEIDIRGGIGGKGVEISSMGVLRSTRIHRMRVRKIKTHPDRPHSFLSCSDDTSIAYSISTPELSIQRISPHRDYVTDLYWKVNSDSSHLDSFYSVSTDKTLQCTVLPSN